LAESGADLKLLIWWVLRHHLTTFGQNSAHQASTRDARDRLRPVQFQGTLEVFDAWVLPC
jgi:hypothetical protein